jgi:transposase
MMTLKEGTKVYAWLGMTKMDLGVEQMAGLVQEEVAGGPFSGDWYMFCGLQRRIIKIIYWDRNGFCVWQKKLERDRFPWPRKGSGVKVLSRDEVELIFRGIDFWNEHKEIEYKKIF